MFRLLLFVPVMFAQNAVDPRAALENAAKSLVRYQPPKAATPVLVTPAGPCAAPLVNALPPGADAAKIRTIAPQSTSNMPVVTVPAPPCPAK
jgi:hypothetical protein